MMEMREVKLKVTETTSTIVQQYAFNYGCAWFFNDRKIVHTDAKYLYIAKDGRITHGDNDAYFYIQKFTEITPAEFICTNSFIKDLE